jgi:lipocalin-like protein
MGNSRKVAGIAVCIAVAGSLVLGGQAWAQQKASVSKKQLSGTWTFVSAESIDKDGMKVPLVVGKDPKGLLVFSGDRFSLQVIADYPKLASNDRLKTTAEEREAVSKAILSYFGTYSVEPDGALTLQIERSGFSNQNGGNFKRTVAVSGDELLLTNPATLAGRVNRLVWKRAK